MKISRVFTAVGESFGFKSGDLEITTAKESFSPETWDRLAVHGWFAKVGDGSAISRDTKTGQSATDGEKFAAMVGIQNRLLNNEWEAAKSGRESNAAIIRRAWEALNPEKDFDLYVSRVAKNNSAAMGREVSVEAVVQGLGAVTVIAAKIAELRAIGAPVLNFDDIA